MKKNFNAGTVAAMARGLITVTKDKTLVPNRTDEEWKVIKHTDILESEAVLRTMSDTYATLQVEDVVSAATDQLSDEKEEEEESGDNTITPEEILRQIKEASHTDGYVIKGERYNMVVSKTLTSVLESLAEGQYHIIQFSINFSSEDSASIEARLKDYVPSKVTFPKGGKERLNDDDNKMIYIVPQLNGFKVTVLFDYIESNEQEKLNKLVEWINNFRGYLLEKTVKEINERSGQNIEIQKSILRSQSSVGLIPKARRRAEQLYRGKDEKGNYRPSTKETREAGRTFANELSEELDLVPLTGELLETGFILLKLTITQDPEVYGQWTSYSKRFSLFSKGGSHGRLERVLVDRKKIPIATCGDLKAEIEEKLLEFIPRLLICMENMARTQLGYDDYLLPYKATDLAILKPTTKNATETMGLETGVQYKIENELSVAVNRKLKAISTGQKADTITKFGNLLASLGMSIEDIKEGN